MRREVLVVLEGRRRRMVERVEVASRHLRPRQQRWWRVVGHGVGWHVTLSLHHVSALVRGEMVCCQGLRYNWFVSRLGRDSRTKLSAQRLHSRCRHHHGAAVQCTVQYTTTCIVYYTQSG